MAIIGIGGLGLHGVQMGRPRDLSVIAIDRLPARVELATQLGADVGIVAAEGWAAPILEASNGGVEAVFDIVGSPDSLAESLKCLRPGGKLLAVAYSPGHPFAADSFALHSGELSVLGTRGGTPGEFEKILCLRAEGRLRGLVDRCFGLEDLNEALALIGSPDVVGRSVVLPG